MVCCRNVQLMPTLSLKLTIEAGAAAAARAAAPAVAPADAHDDNNDNAHGSDEQTLRRRSQLFQSPNCR